MTVREIVEKYLGQYKEVSAGNLQVKKCPFCDREKGKFYIKEDTGVYICHSGSCGAKGTLPQLVKHLEEKLGVKIAEPKASKKKKGDKVNLQFKKEDIGTLFNSSGEENPNAKETIEYINSRGISTKTTRDMDVFYRKSDKSVIFAYKNLDGNLAGVKYRSVREKKFSQATGSQAYLWNLERATNKKVVICEGEWDCLSLAEAGLMDRALSVPMGTGNLDWIDNCREFLESKEEIILAFDTDEAGEKALRKVSQRLQHLNIRKIELGAYKDINDFFLFEGKDELIKVLENSKEIELQGLETFYEVGRYDINKLDRFPFGINVLDRVTRGAKEGELIILAGDNGSGKTLISKQFVLNARSKGKKVLVVNGEIQNEIYKEDLFKQANGDNKLVKTEDILIRGEYDYRVSDENYNLINEWLNGYLYTMSDQEELTDKNVLSMIESSIIKNNAFFIVVDNLSVIHCEGENEAEAKGRFAVALKNLAKKHGVCILLVNHFTKGAKDRGKEGIKGSGIISDIADMVFISEREDNPDIEANGYLNVVKNRLNGKLQKIDLYFNPIYKTLLDDPDQVLKFNWKEFNEIKAELENDDELPF